MKPANSNVVINALDVRGLYVGNADASQGNNATLSQLNGETSMDHLSGMQASENAMAELSNGTGGYVLHNSNDLLGGLKSLSAAPEYMYWLTVSLKDVKANGTFHQLKVKVNRPECGCASPARVCRSEANERQQIGLHRQTEFGLNGAGVG